jgi:hypothetical protein
VAVTQAWTEYNTMIILMNSHHSAKLFTLILFEHTRLPTGPIYYQ